MNRRNFLKKSVSLSTFPLLMTPQLHRHALGAFIRESSSNKNAEEIAKDEDFWSTIQNMFPVDRTIINLNNGGVSPAPRQVIDSLKEKIDYSNLMPAYTMWRHLEPNIESVRTLLASSFGCDTEEIAITRNASESLENIQFGLSLVKGDEVLTTDQDYPRMLTTWDQRRRRDGVVIKKIVLPIPLVNDDDILQLLREAITPKTRVIHISHVIFLSGQILPVAKIAKLAEEHNLPLICDGAHSFNHIPFKLADIQCTFFGSSLHKWTYAPIGTGFLYIKKSEIKNIWPLMAAEEKLTEDIRKFEEIGTHPAAIHNAIIDALLFNEQIGIARKAARLRYLHSIWLERAEKMSNISFMTNIANKEQWCGIVTFRIDGVDMEKMNNWLLHEKKIFTVSINHNGFKGLRITPNVYTSISEMQRFADAVELAATGKVAAIKS